MAPVPKTAKEWSLYEDPGVQADALAQYSDAVLDTVAAQHESTKNSSSELFWQQQLTVACMLQMSSDALMCERLESQCGGYAVPAIALLDRMSRSMQPPASVLGSVESGISVGFRLDAN